MKTSRISNHAIIQLPRVTCLHVYHTGLYWWQYLHLSPCARPGGDILVTWTLLFDILVSLEKGNYLYLLMLGCCRAATGVKRRNFRLFTRSCKVAHFNSIDDARFLVALCLQISSMNPTVSYMMRDFVDSAVKNLFSSKNVCYLYLFYFIYICGGKTFLWVRAASWYGGRWCEWQM